MKKLSFFHTPFFCAHFFPKIKNRKGTQMQERGKIWSSIILQSTLGLPAADTY